MTIRKSITVSRLPDTAFRAFTAQIGAWWPLKEGFSFGRDRAKDIFIEPRVGGRFYERFTDGTEFEVGRVTAYEPPNVVSFTWKDPRWEASTEVEVRFIADSAGTRVELEHRGWEQGPVMEKEGKSYEEGWGFLLTRFVTHAAA